MSDREPFADAAPTEDIVSGERDPFDRMAEEFAARCRKGESPSISEYAARFPDDAEKARKLLETVAMMEQLRRGSRQARFLPERLGEFRVLRELGRGGMGVVYEAVQESLWRHVAVKAMHHIHLDPRRLKRFQREAQAVAQLHHTNIVPIFGVGEHEGLPYYVMQFIKGHGLDVELETWRREGAPSPEGRWRLAARVGVQASGALQYAHDQGILHRDIKPSNLLVDEQGAIWITDFGLAKLAGHDDLTASGDVIGTLRYLAPEALHGNSDHRSDIFSLGLTLYELITLNSPYGELSPSELLRRVSEGSPTPPRRLVPTIPLDLETIVLKSIAHEPGHRYQSAAEFADDLRNFLEDRPIRARRATQVERALRWSRRNRAVASLTAAAAGSLLLAAATGWLGYAGASQALEREKELVNKATQSRQDSERNLDMALAVLDNVFQIVAPTEDDAVPPLGMLGRRRDALLGGGPDGLGGPGGRDHGPPPGGDRGGPDRFGGPGGPDGHMPPEMRRGRAGLSGNDAALLQKVLSFYDEFARQNSGKAGAKLQAEAAWAYCKVAYLYQRTGRDAEAAEAKDRSIAMFEQIIAVAPADPAANESKLVKAIIMDDPWDAPEGSLEVLAARLRKARALVDRLVAAKPDDLSARKDQLQAYTKLGVALRRLGRSDEAEACYREAIALADKMLERRPGDEIPMLDRATIRMALVELLDTQGKADEVKPALDEIVADVRAADAGGGPLPAIYDRASGLARLFEQLKQPERAAEMNQWVVEMKSRPIDSVLPRHRGSGRGHGPDGLGPPR